MQAAADLIRTPSRNGRCRPCLEIPGARSCCCVDGRPTPHTIIGWTTTHPSLSSMLAPAEDAPKSYLVCWTGTAYARVTVRNPMLPVDELGVFEERAALRYLMQYESSHRYDPPRNTLPRPCSGPVGSRTAEVAYVSSRHQSQHHFQTLADGLPQAVVVRGVRADRRRGEVVVVHRVGDGELALPDVAPVRPSNGWSRRPPPKWHLSGCRSWFTTCSLGA